MRITSFVPMLLRGNQKPDSALWETTYPSDQRNALAYDETLSDAVIEEFIKTRIANFFEEPAGSP
jgi:hypothetical protein